MDRQLRLGGERASAIVEGGVERILHRNEDTGWSVVLIDAEGEGRIKAVGNFLGVQPGDHLALGGDWVEHPKFGRQLKISSYEPVAPKSLDGIESYLAGFIDGIDTKLARKIVKTFGEQALGILHEEPHRLIEVHGIGKKRRKQILAAFKESRKIQDAMVLLQGHGISAAFAAKIYQRFEDKTIEVVRKQPYRLTEIRGLGFHRADAIARAQGLPRDSAQRVGAGARHGLEEASAREGHMFLCRADLLARTQRLLGDISADQVTSGIASELECGRFVAVGKAIYLRGLERAERVLALRIEALLARPAPPLKVDVEMAIDNFEARERLVLAEAQRQTLREMVASKVMVLTGGPGTGKTTLTKGIVDVARLAGLKTELAAPTGRAAKRLGEATKAEAKTLHRLLEYQGDGFARHAENPLEVDLLVVDEASMLDTPLARRLLDALPDATRLILVGDVDQLPSVGPGRVLGDLIESGKIPVVRLTEIFRQAQKSLIVVNAHRVIQGEVPVPGKDPETADFFVASRPDPTLALAQVEGLVASRISARFGFAPGRDIQVLAPMRRGILGVENLNSRLQKLLNPAPPAPKWAGKRFREGDRVMQTSNNYDLEVFNGEIGHIAGFDEREKQVLVKLDERVVGYPPERLEELELAYAVTIHKAQGSEFPCVVIVLHSQHSVMLQRNLLYTAITRGKKLVLVVGDRRALETASRTETTLRRETLLVERLQGSLETAKAR